MREPFMSLKRSPPPREKDASADGQPHFWTFKLHEKGISRGICDCGAVKFFANTESRKFLDRAALLNGLHGKKGGGHLIKALAEKIDSPEKKEEPIMSKEESHLAPVPPRPDTTGKSKFQVNIELHDYYEEFAADILADREKIGDTPAEKRWGFSDFGWRAFKERHGIPVPKVKRHKPKTGAAAPAQEKEPEPEAETEPEPEPEPKPEPEPEPEPEVETAPEEENWVYIYACAHCPAKFDKREDLMAHVKLHLKPAIPTFPPFDPKWKKEVQIEWLRAYAVLARIRGTHASE